MSVCIEQVVAEVRRGDQVSQMGILNVEQKVMVNIQCRCWTLNVSALIEQEVQY